MSGPPEPGGSTQPSPLPDPASWEKTSNSVAVYMGCIFAIAIVLITLILAARYLQGGSLTFTHADENEGLQLYLPPPPTPVLHDIIIGGTTTTTGSRLVDICPVSLRRRWQRYELLEPRKRTRNFQATFIIAMPREGADSPVEVEFGVTDVIQTETS